MIGRDNQTGHRRPAAQKGLAASVRVAPVVRTSSISRTGGSLAGYAILSRLEPGSGCLATRLKAWRRFRDALFPAYLLALPAGCAARHRKPTSPAFPGCRRSVRPAARPGCSPVRAGGTCAAGPRRQRPDAGRSARIYLDQQGSQARGEIRRVAELEAQQCLAQGALVIGQRSKCPIRRNFRGKQGSDLERFCAGFPAGCGRQGQALAADPGELPGPDRRPAGKKRRWAGKRYPGSLCRKHSSLCSSIRGGSFRAISVQAAAASPSAGCSASYAWLLASMPANVRRDVTSSSFCRARVTAV